MKKLEKRSLICVLIALVLTAGTGVFVYRFVNYGGDWATFYGNTQIYTDGMLNRGTVTDRYGEVLLDCTPDGIYYNDSWSVRCATVHAAGDPKGNISTGAINAFKSQLIGYDILNGTYDSNAEGKRIALTIDANANVAAMEALGGRTGTVGVMNWKTGEILCMVSTPTFDPAGVLPEDSESSYYFNNFIQGTVTPGSTFKLVTAAAVIDNLDDRSKFSFDCDGKNEYHGEDFTDIYTHGTVDFRGALAQSCNGAFGELTREVGAATMKKYVRKIGLTKSIEINGVETAAGSFDFTPDDEIKLSWSGVGQGDDMVNPCTMLVFVASVANGGTAIQPTLIKSATFLKELAGGAPMGSTVSGSTADELRSMMKNNVVANYGEDNFPGLDLYAKSGTAEVGDRQDALFTGFIDNEKHPYAFFVWIRDGGSGAGAAAPVARTVLNQLISDSE